MEEFEPIIVRLRRHRVAPVTIANQIIVFTKLRTKICRQKMTPTFADINNHCEIGCLNVTEQTIGTHFIPVQSWTSRALVYLIVPWSIHYHGVTGNFTRERQKSLHKRTITGNLARV